MRNLIAFMQKHWVVYTIAAIVAISLGFAAAYVISLVGSTTY